MWYVVAIVFPVVYVLLGILQTAVILKYEDRSARSYKEQEVLFAVLAWPFILGFYGVQGLYGVPQASKNLVKAVDRSLTKAVANLQDFLQS